MSRFPRIPVFAGVLNIHLVHESPPPIIVSRMAAPLDNDQGLGD